MVHADYTMYFYALQVLLNKELIDVNQVKNDMYLLHRIFLQTVKGEGAFILYLN